MEEIKHTAILYIAYHNINNFMKSSDLCPPGKVFYTSHQ
jgi:hypothetical protein